jgi:hypothetical protein
LFEGPSSSKSSSVSQQYNISLVDEVIMSIPYSVDTGLVLGGDVSLEHFVSHPLQPMVEEVVMSMQYSADPTLLLESDESSKVVKPMKYSVDPTLLSRSDAYFDYIFIISSSVPSEQGGIPISSSMLPPSLRMVSSDWNNIVEPRFPSSAPFQIMVLVESMLKGIHRCVIDEGFSASILSSSAWQAFGSPKHVSSTSELLYFDKRPSKCLGILPRFPITLGGKDFLINLLVVPIPLDFNMLHGCDYVLCYERCGVYALSYDVFPSQWNHCHY